MVDQVFYWFRLESQGLPQIFVGFPEYLGRHQDKRILRALSMEKHLLTRENGYFRKTNEKISKELKNACKMTKPAGV